MSYSISSDNQTITINERGLASTTAVTHADESIVECYNLDGIPLTEINKTHTGILNPLWILMNSAHLLSQDLVLLVVAA